MNTNRPILPNGAELPDGIDFDFDALHISRDTSKSIDIHLLSTSGVEECIYCIRIDGRINGTQLEDYKPFVPGSHFSAYDTENFCKISCPDCEQLVDPYMVQVHRRIDCFNKHKL